MRIPGSPIIVTHNGSFHADEIFGCAVLKLVYPDATIVRSRDTEIIATADIVLDVGGQYDFNENRFDHHQIGGAGVRGNGIPYASFGLIWKHFGVQVCGGDVQVWEAIDKKLVQPIDASDVGIDISTSLREGLFPYTVGMVFGLFAPTWRERTDENFDQLSDEGFLKSLTLAVEILQREVVMNQDNFEARRLIQNLYESSVDARLIITTDSIPRNVWYEFIADFPEITYIVTRREEGKWNVIAQRAKAGEKASRKPFPESWAGLRDSELEQVTGVMGAKFCHTARFLCTADSREAAIALAQTALDA